MKTLFKYIIALIINSLIILFVLDFFIMPLFINKKNEIYLPNVKGKDISEAKSILNDFNIKVFYNKYIDQYNPGEVINQSPRAFTKLKKNREIKLTVVGKREDIIVEDYYNQSLRSVQLKLDRQNILIDTLIYEFNELIDKDYVINQFPNKGTIYNNKLITLILSLGKPPDYYIVPDLINISYNKAKQLISNSGLLIGDIKYEYVDTLLNNTVIYQDHPAHKRLSMPLKINLIISTDEVEKK